MFSNTYNSERTKSFKGKHSIIFYSEFKLFKPIIIISIMLLCCTGCNKVVDVKPPVTGITSESAYKSDATAIALVTGLYTQLSGTLYYQTGLPTISLLGGLLSDELTLWSGVTNTTQIAYYRNNLTTVPEEGHQFWYTLYPYIFTCNSAIEGLTNANNLTPKVKNQLLGEVRFMRAFFYFHLVNLYNDVPIITSTDWKLNSTPSRSSKDDVYKFIISDLESAKDFLQDTYQDGTLNNTSTERVRPSKWTAYAMLARAYLFSGDWNKAETNATNIISNTSQFQLSTLANTFLKAGLANKEAIWQLQPVSKANGITNTQDAALFILPSTGPSASNLGNPVYLSNNLLSAFESGDNRRKVWVDSVIVNGVIYYYPAKYKVKGQNATVSEYPMVLRLAEQYLIRAEARAKQNNLPGAIADLDSIRKRAGVLLLSVTEPGISQSSLLDKILHERQVELFTEWGHRWFDLKRAGKINSVMSVVTPTKGGSWQITDQLLPIPISEIQKNPNLSQNPGY